MKRLLFWFAAILIAARLHATELPSQPTNTQYIVKLRYLFVQPNASSAAPIQDVVTGLGGHVDLSWIDRVVVTLPDTAVQALLQLPAVKYMQRVIHGLPSQTTNPLRALTPGSLSVPNVTRPRSPDSSPPWDSGTYAYDGAGNIKAIGDDTYTYDQFSRLSQSTVRGHNETYTYDEFGNLTKKQTDSLTVDLSVDTGGHNQLKYQNYDVAGNLTGDSSETNNFDPLSMQREKIVSGGAHEYYVYDAGDERIAVISDPCPGVLPASCTSSLITLSARGEDGRVLRQFDVPYSQFSTSPFWWLEDYVYRDGLPLAGERMPAEGGRRHFHLDHLGTPRLVTGTSGQHISEHDYYPFGVEITSSSQEAPAGFDREEPMKFTGHLRDFNLTGTSGDNQNYNDFMHARNTVPQWGRFLSLDPIGRNVPVERAHLWNRYLYGGANPVRFVDRDGKDIIDVIIEHYIAKPVAPGPSGFLLGDDRGVSLNPMRSFRTKRVITINTASQTWSEARRTSPSVNLSTGQVAQARGDSLAPASVDFSGARITVQASQNEEVPKEVTSGIGSLGAGIRSNVLLMLSPAGAPLSASIMIAAFPSMQLSVFNETTGESTIVFTQGESLTPLGLFMLSRYTVTCAIFCSPTGTPK